MDVAAAVSAGLIHIVAFGENKDYAWHFSAGKVLIVTVSSSDKYTAVGGPGLFRMGGRGG